MDILNITLFTDAALNIGLGGYSDQGQWFKNNWNDTQLHHENSREIVWKELTAINSSTEMIIIQSVVWLHWGNV